MLQVCSVSFPNLINESQLHYKNLTFWEMLIKQHCIRTAYPSNSHEQGDSMTLWRNEIATPNHGLEGLAWLWWHKLQATHPLAEARVVEVEKAAFQSSSLLWRQRPKLWKSCFLHGFSQIAATLLLGHNATKSQMKRERNNSYWCKSDTGSFESPKGLTCSYGGSLCAGINRETKYRAGELPSCRFKTIVL